MTRYIDLNEEVKQFSIKRVGVTWLKYEKGQYNAVKFRAGSYTALIGFRLRKEQ